MEIRLYWGVFALYTIVNKFWGETYGISKKYFF